MANFLEIKIPVKRDAKWSDWAKEMRSTIKSAGIPVRWQLFHYHMTLLFLDDDEYVEDLTQEFEQCMSVLYSFPLTIDRLAAFTTGDGSSHIIYLTSSQVPSQILTFADDARTSLWVVSLQKRCRLSNCKPFYVQLINHCLIASSMRLNIVISGVIK